MALTDDAGGLDQARLQHPAPGPARSTWDSSRDWPPAPPCESARSSTPAGRRPPRQARQVLVRAVPLLVFLGVADAVVGRPVDHPQPGLASWGHVAHGHLVRDAQHGQVRAEGGYPSRVEEFLLDLDLLAEAGKNPSIGPSSFGGRRRPAAPPADAASASGSPPARVSAAADENDPDLLGRLAHVSSFDSQEKKKRKTQLHRFQDCADKKRRGEDEEGMRETVGKPNRR